jgi:hypothetical protein
MQEPQLRGGLRTWDEKHQTKIAPRGRMVQCLWCRVLFRGTKSHHKSMIFVFSQSSFVFCKGIDDKYRTRIDHINPFFECPCRNSPLEGKKRSHPKMQKCWNAGMLNATVRKCILALEILVVGLFIRGM